MGKRGKRSSWEWYAVKLLFESTIKGESDKAKLDEKFSNANKLYEEQIVVVRAQSSEHAFRAAEVGAKKGELMYTNPYGQTVCCKFVDSLICQRLFDRQIKSGTEVFSRLFMEPVEVEMSAVIEKHFPESLSRTEDKGMHTPFYNFLIEG